MARQECSIKAHRWKPRPRGAGEVCEICHAHFPCDERDCGHYDCIDVRRKTEHPPICFHCRRKVDLTEGSLTVSTHDGKVDFRCYTIGVRGRTKLVCKLCLDKETSE